MSTHHFGCIYNKIKKLLRRGRTGIKSYQQIIRELREDHDLTQADVAKMLKTTQQMYSRYENGTCELPIRHLIKLCAVYHVSVDYILQIGNAEESPAPSL